MYAELLNAVVIVLALGVSVGLLVLHIARHFSLQRSCSIKDSGPLSEAEKRGLRAWARRTKVSFAGCMLFVALNNILLIVTNLAPLWLGWLGLGAHRPKRVRELIEGRGCELLYLPAYSPDHRTR